jgi:hypothetical protein
MIFFLKKSLKKAFNFGGVGGAPQGIVFGGKIGRAWVVVNNR